METMELLTTVKNFAKDIQYHHLAPETHIRVIIYESRTGWEQVYPARILLPIITPEEQRRRLQLIPRDYDPEASEELIHLIDRSHTNTTIPEL